ncbi:MAG: hypothetical protein KJ077_11195 [Anaerolineae bacterium]|nr:hypothetical protein [Anaerolineae bacterium]
MLFLSRFKFIREHWRGFWAERCRALRRRLRRFLDVDTLDGRVAQIEKKWGGSQTIMAVDVSPLDKEQSVVVIASRLNGGHVIIQGVHFGSAVEIRELARYLAERYRIPERLIFWDGPPGMHDRLRR